MTSFEEVHSIKCPLTVIRFIRELFPLIQFEICETGVGVYVMMQFILIAVTPTDICVIQLFLLGRDDTDFLACQLIVILPSWATFCKIIRNMSLLCENSSRMTNDCLYPTAHATLKDNKLEKLSCHINVFINVRIMKRLNLYFLLLTCQC